MAPSVDRGAERREQLLGTLLDDAAFIWIALAQRTHQRLGLFPGDMRRQRRHIGVGDELDDDRAIGCQRQIPGRADVIRLVDADALEAEHLAIARACQLDGVLPGLEIRNNRQLALLPSYRIETVLGPPPTNHTR